MNILWTLFGILSILLHVHDISGAKFYTIRNSSSGPLALIKEQNILNIAIPHKVGNRKDIAEYFYNLDIEQGSVQELLIACPAHNDQQKKVEEKWKSRNKASKETRLFFLQEYSAPNTECLSNEQHAGPWIEKTETECGNTNGYIYEVGYPVNIWEDEEKVLFMSIYEICYSKTEGDGIIYTTHRIDSPSLMLLSVYENYQPSMEMTFKSPLDAELKDVKKFYKNKNIYQFVPRHDMPTVLWGNTTFFPFNYLPIDSDIFINLLKYDNYIRLYSKQTNTPLTIYSGTHQITISEVCTTLCFRTRNVMVPIDLVWKAMVDHQQRGIILITQLTKRQCITSTQHMCSVHLMVLQNYNNGGCTYTCPLSPGMMSLLKLPKLEVKEMLIIAYDKAVEMESEITPVDAGGQTSSTQVSIADFANSTSFVSALNSVDHATVVAMHAEGALGSHIDDGQDDGADDGGPGEGGE